MKTQMSRFHIHDDLSAPEGSLPVLKGALSSAGQLPNFLGALAGSPAALRGYTRFRAELRHGSLDGADRERIALAVAEHYRSEPGIQHPLAHRPPRRRRHRRGRQGPRLGLRRPGPGRAAPLPPGAPRAARPRADAPPRGGPRGGLERRAAARGDRLRLARVHDRDGQRRGRHPRRRLGGGRSRPAGRRRLPRDGRSRARSPSRPWSARRRSAAPSSTTRSS